MFKFTVFADYLKPTENRYANIYGSSQIFPSAKLGAKIFKFFGLYVSYGYLQTSGELKEISENTKSTQQILSAGGEFFFNISV